MSKVSIIVPCYNLGRFIEQALDSLCEQTYKDWECVIVNDGSTDDSPAIIQNYVSSAKGAFVCVHKENGGVASAMNEGFQYAHDEYVVVLSSDDYLDNTYLEKTVSVLDSRKDVDIVGVDTRMFGEQNFYHTTGACLDLQQLMFADNLHYCCIMRRYVWETIGGFTIDLPFEDWDFWISAAEYGFTLTKINEPLFNYRVRSDGREAQTNKNYAQARAQVLSRHQLVKN